jgi:hypothetical protein
MSIPPNIPLQPCCPSAQCACAVPVALDAVTTASHAEVLTHLLTQATALCGVLCASVAEGVAPRHDLGVTLGLLEELCGAALSIVQPRPGMTPPAPAPSA